MQTSLSNAANSSSEHIAYAMRNEEARQSLISFNWPSEILDWSHLAIEGMIIIGFIFSIIHACKYKKNTRSLFAILTLVNCFLYGLTIDIISYYTVENFWHGEFSVMFLYNRLPLYIALFYPTFMYHACMIIRRYEFGPWVEAVCTGFFAGLLYLIFDNLGPMVNWWVWDANSPTTLPYLSNTPLTSYHWFFLFTISFTLVNRAIYALHKKYASNLKLMLAILIQPVLTILLGALFFMPYNLFAKSQPPYDLLPWDKNLPMAAFVHAMLFAAAAWLFLTHWKKPQLNKDSLLMAFPFMYLLGHLFIYTAKFDESFMPLLSNASVSLPQANLFAVTIAIVACSLIVIKTCNTEIKERS